MRLLVLVDSGNKRGGGNPRGHPVGGQAQGRWVIFSVFLTRKVGRVILLSRFSLRQLLLFV